MKYKTKVARISKYIKPKQVKANIDYSLSKRQETISFSINESSNDIYVDAVCGAGKTEIVFRSIENAIEKGERVGFVIPRREVVVEIYNRLKNVYPTLNVVSVYGGHNEFLDGDIVCLTCHQCSRYRGKFGLIVLDEYDAFPLKGDNVLLNIVKKTCYGKIIYLSATFSREFLADKNSISMERRFHGYDMPIPNIVETSILKQVFKTIKIIKNDPENSYFIFCPTIKMCNIIDTALRFFKIKSMVFTSKSTEKEKIFDKIKSKELKIVVCTTILERGITVSGLNIIVLYSDHKLFDCSTLIQICGRVGRKSTNPHGEINLFCKSRTISINSCLSTIINKNT